MKKRRFRICIELTADDRMQVELELAFGQRRPVFFPYSSNCRAEGRCDPMKSILGRCFLGKTLFEIDERLVAD
jgi:hypothetical protein